MNKGIRIAIILLVGLGLWFMPAPDGLSVKGLHLFAIIAATIIGYILQPIPMGAIGITAVAVCVLTKTTTLGEALSGYSNGTTWLIVAAVLFARSFIQSGLGTRIAYLVIKSLGSNSLKLGYAIVISDLIMAPATPSNTARAGGILFPIVRSLSLAFKSEPDEQTRKNLGAYLTQTLYQSVVITSMMFITAIASNSLVIIFAKQVADVDLSWITWALAAMAPGLISLLLLPLVMYKLYGPKIKSTPEARQIAMRELEKLGPMSRNEKIVATVFVMALLLWATTEWTGLSATTVALLSVVAVIWLGAISYQDMLKETMAWDSFLWMGTLIGLAGLLVKFGFIKWLATTIAASMVGISWVTALYVLAFAYIFSHYFFAATSSHATAMYAAFLAVAISAGAPPYYAALFLAFSSVMCAGLTHYGMGPAPVLFSSGYVTQSEWWRLGLIFVVINGAIWFGLGPIWWRVMGLW